MLVTRRKTYNFLQLKGTGEAPLGASNVVTKSVALTILTAF